MTHRRPRLASAAVRHLIEGEGFLPDQVLVIVNGDGGLDDPELRARVEVLELEENLGPAGGFDAGLRHVFADPTVQWAYLCEDDVSLLGLPTPRVADLLQRIAGHTDGNPVGAVCAFGRVFERRTGHTRNFVPRRGSAGDLTAVDVAMWGATLVSRAVTEAGVHPDAELFFGFEDFDFFCAIRDAGFSLLVDARSARRVMAYQTGAGRDEALGSQRPTDAEEPWRAYYVARNFFALARRHGRPAWIGWHLLYSGRRLQLATSGAERRAILSGLLHGALRRTGRNPRYLRVVGERPAPIPTSPTIVATSPETTAKELAGQCLALVVSHNAPGALARCLDAIVAQTVPPAGAVVVDNGSLPALAGDDLQRPGLAVAVVRSERNTGPAGGWALAFESFLRAGYRLAWVLDDDIVPDEDCLERILDGCAADPDRAFGFPRSIQPDGSVGEWGSWCGFVVARRIVEQVGVPRADLFWWAEDNEYTHWRIPKAGYPRRIVDGAVVQHDAVRHAAYVPTWKYYYEARNMLYLHLHLMRRVGWYPRNVATLIGRALLREKGRRLRSLAALGRGLVDGLVGRLGVRYPVEPMREQGTLDHAANEGVPTTAPPAEAVPA